MTDYTTTFTVGNTPQEVFAAINNVRGWWSAEVEGDSEKLGDEFTFNVPDVHYSKIRLTEVVPGKKVVWHVLDAYLTFIEDKTEWTDTEIVFDVSEKDGGTEVRFTHVGLLPEVECYELCSTAWTSYVAGSLRDLITTGKGDPFRSGGDFESEKARAASFAARDLVQ